MTDKPEDLIHELRAVSTSQEEYTHQAADLIEELLAQNRRLQDELEKAKADLGARNRILTEDP